MNEKLFKDQNIRINDLKRASPTSKINRSDFMIDL